MLVECPHLAKPPTKPTKETGLISPKRPKSPVNKCIANEQKDVGRSRVVERVASYQGAAKKA